MATHIARPNQPRVVPAFVVQERNEEVVRTVLTKDTKGNYKKVETKVPYGYHVSFPAKGHSIRVATASELKRLGFDKTIPLVDANSDNDDVLGEMPNSVKV